MRGIARNCGFDILAIGGTENHIHILLSLPRRGNLVDVLLYRLSRPVYPFGDSHTRKNQDRRESYEQWYS